jgi:hypothetical protein
MPRPTTETPQFRGYFDGRWVSGPRFRVLHAPSRNDTSFRFCPHPPPLTVRLVQGKPKGSRGHGARRTSAASLMASDRPTRRAIQARKYAYGVGEMVGTPTCICAAEASRHHTRGFECSCYAEVFVRPCTPVARFKNAPRPSTARGAHCGPRRSRRNDDPVLVLGELEACRWAIASHPGPENLQDLRLLGLFGECDLDGEPEISY